MRKAQGEKATSKLESAVVGDSKQSLAQAQAEVGRAQVTDEARATEALRLLALARDEVGRARAAASAARERCEVVEAQLRALDHSGIQRLRDRASDAERDLEELRERFDDARESWRSENDALLEENARLRARHAGVSTA